MPPSRRQPRSTPPARRPRVAGLRKPSPGPSAPPSPATEEETTSAATRPRPTPRPSAASPSEEPRFPDAGVPATTGLSDSASADTADAAAEADAASSSEAETARIAADPITGEPESTAPETDEPETSSAEMAEPETSELPVEDAKPSPRRKARDEWRSKPVDVEEAEAEAAGKPAYAASAPSKPGVPWGYLVAGILFVVGLLFTAGAVIFVLKGNEAADSTSNTALLDVAKTAQVKDQMSKATEALFSYDYNNIKKTEDAANDLLANDEVRGKYNALMGEVKRLAPQQKMVVTAKVTRSAVIMLNGDLAKVILFVDQTSTRADTKKTTAGSAQLHVNAQLQGDKWKVTDMDTYQAPQPPQQSAPPSSPAPPSK
ncbi:hypothetical protein ACFWY9_23480 [Amycolatopsis sp. NPDC059027]|uniref:hypothetical protein n=1 Tax=unclassified Amycolatopsis TaxID=2618356 RepID=UPI00366BF480